MLNRKLFVEYPEEFSPEYKSYNPAPVFRSVFTCEKKPLKATLEFCGLGIGYCFFNENRVTDDLFTAPVSDYNKTIWYNRYDVTDKIINGDNLIAVILGNGFYNESIDTTWNLHLGNWRGLPKFALKLKLEFDDQVKYITSDENFICSKNSPVVFNELRSGEACDLRIGNAWKNFGYDTSGFVNARHSENVPKGVLRRCNCQPIREFESYTAKNIFLNSVGNYVIDFGQNISGYVRVKLKGKCGQELKIKYTERLFDDGTCNFNRMDHNSYYLNCDFQTDRIILSGKEDVWTPMFSYHGFRYIEIAGLENKPSAENFTAVFVHQAVESVSDFKCSDETLNKLFKMARISSYSNMFYSITDCPTREKLGWLNDAQASCEQMLQNYDIYPLFEKWIRDVCDTELEDGQIPGIAPCYGWGYQWGTGPVSSGIIFELPYRMYRYTGKKSCLNFVYPYMIRHFRYIVSNVDKADGLIGYGLNDWSGPFVPAESSPTPVKFSDTILTIKFARILKFFSVLLKNHNDAVYIENTEKRLIAAFFKAFVNKDGSSRICEQTAVSMMIVSGIYNDLEPLKKQLISEIKKYDYHHHCGMLGLQYLFKALNICGLQEYGYKILTADGHPSFKEWINDGGTTLYEHWDNTDSNNHHMFSCFTAWMNMTIAGLNLDDRICAYKRATISPYFFEKLDYCNAEYDTVSGKYEISWKRIDSGRINLYINVPSGCVANLSLIGGYQLESGLVKEKLKSGKYNFACYKNR